MQEIITTLQAPAGDTAVKRKRADKKRPDKKADKERPHKKTKVCDPKKGEWADGTDVGAYIREQLTKISAKKNLSALTTAKEDLLVDLILGMMPRSEVQMERICRAVRLCVEGRDFASVADVREIMSSKRHNNYCNTVVVHIDTM